MSKLIPRTHLATVLKAWVQWVQHSVDFKDPVRCLRADVERKHGLAVDPHWALWTHMVPYVARLVERFKVRGNKHTSCEDCFVVCYRGELIPYGATILFRHSFNSAGRGPRKMKISIANHRMENGI